MLATTICNLFIFVGIVLSAPAPVPKLVGSPGIINPTSPVPHPIAFSDLGKRTLHPEEVVVYGQDRAEIWPKSMYLAANTGLLSHPGHNISSQDTTLDEDISPNRNHSTPHLQKRGCSWKNIVYEKPTQTFLDWDQAISPVVHNAYSTVKVSITKSHAIKQGVTTTAKGSGTLIESVFSITASIAYEHTWTTTDTSELTFYVPQDLYGVIVSNAKATRYSGTVKYGCIGNAEDQWDFYTDKYTDKSYGGMNWVDGVIGLCTSANYPIPGCIGGQPIE